MLDGTVKTSHEGLGLLGFEMERLQGWQVAARCVMICDVHQHRQIIIYFSFRSGRRFGSSSRLRGCACDLTDRANVTQNSTHSIQTEIFAARKTRLLNESKSSATTATTVAMMMEERQTASKPIVAPEPIGQVQEIRKVC